MFAPSPETELVLLAARPSRDSMANNRLDRLIQTGVDWDALEAIAERHGLVPALASALRGAEIPADVARRLSDRSREIARRNLQMTQELLAVLGGLEAAGVKAVTFKGPTLAMELYDSLGQRQFTDLDLLVSKAERDRAVDWLSERGYRPIDAKSDREHEVLADGIGQLGLYHEARQIRLEVHTDLGPPYLRFGLATAVLARARSISIFGTPVRTMARDDLALYLCLHGLKHGWERLAWLCDLARLVERERKFDWVALHRRARNLGHPRAVLLGLALCERLLCVPAPMKVLPAIKRDRVTAQLARQVEAALFDERPEPEFAPLRTIYFLASPMRGKFRQFLFRAFRPQLADLRAVHLPDRLRIGYYAIRPLRLAIVRLPRMALNVLRG